MPKTIDLFEMLLYLQDRETHPYGHIEHRGKDCHERSQCRILQPAVLRKIILCLSRKIGDAVYRLLTDNTLDQTTIFIKLNSKILLTVTTVM